ncbi:hypothetical protein D910_09069, partial [Dendroctonus ponderosae]
MDNFWGGKNDLTAALGFEKDGITTILFRKKLDATEPADHSIEEDLMHVIFAQGQEPGRYVHVPESGVETPQASQKDFYKPDELKYHGHRNQRGVASINFFEEKKDVMPAGAGATSDSAQNTDCGGLWKVPKGCSPENNTCEYSAKWELIPRKDEIRISWTDHITNKEVLQRIGKERQITLTVKKRKLEYLGHIMRHQKYHEVYDYVTTTESPGLGYTVQVKLIELGENFVAPKPGTIEYEDLSTSISNNFQPVFRSLPGYRRLIVEQLNDESNNIVAVMNLQLDKAMAEKGRALSEGEDTNEQVHKAVQESVGSGRIGNLKVDPRYLVFEPQSLTSNLVPDSDGSTVSSGFFDMPSTKLYIVLGCIAALVLVALVQAGCTVYRATGRRNANRHK